MTGDSEPSPAPALRRGPDLAAFLLYAAAASFFGAVNASGPYHRDGSHFLYMAQQTLHGNPPYFASVDTKNPGVELYWAAFHWLTGGDQLVASARAAEALVIALTAFLTYFLLRRGRVAPGSPWTLPFAAGLGTLILMSHWRVTDNGFNISLYQPLPEMAALALLVPAISGGPLFSLGFGLAAFVAWFTKQTSLVSIAFPTLLLLIAFRRRIPWSTAIPCATAGILVPAALFAIHLSLSGTGANYLWGTLELNYLFSTSPVEDWPDQLRRLFTVTDGASCVPALFFAAFALLSGLNAVDLFRGRRAGTARLFAFVLWAWGFGFALQALLKLTFYRHYFLSGIPFTALTFALLAGRLPKRVQPALAGAAFLAGLAAVGFYGGERAALEKASADYPLFRASAEIAPFIAPTDRVFNWAGLLHLALPLDRRSPYSPNMWWPWIDFRLDESERSARLAEALRREPPDKIIQFFEVYPEKVFSSVRYDADQWSAIVGRNCRLAVTTPARAGRYGNPVEIFSCE